jgi:hypothetical protein
MTAQYVFDTPMLKMVGDMLSVAPETLIHDKARRLLVKDTAPGQPLYYKLVSTQEVFNPNINEWALATAGLALITIVVAASILEP